MRNKTMFFIGFFWLFMIYISYAESILQGPFDLETGFRQYEIQTDKKIFHLEKDNELNNFKGHCTWFCYAVTEERMPLGNAWTWYSSYAKKYPSRVGNMPKVGAICVWEGDYCIDPITQEKYGHVAKVTKVNSDNSFEIWESNYRPFQITRRLVTDRSQILGFIYPLYETMDKLEQVKRDSTLDLIQLKKQNLISTGPSINYKKYKFVKRIRFNTGVNSIAVHNNTITCITDTAHMCKIVNINVDGKEINSSHKIGQYFLKDCYQIRNFMGNIVAMVKASYKKEYAQEQRYIFFFSKNNTEPQKIGEGSGNKPGQYFKWNLPEIKFDISGNFYITDDFQGFGRIQKFSSQGIFIRQITNHDFPKLIYPKILFCLNKKIYIKIEKGDCRHGTRILIFDEHLGFLEEKIWDLNAKHPKRSILGSDITNACTDHMGNIYFIFHNGFMKKYDRNFKFIMFKEIGHSSTQIVIDEFGKIFILYGGHYHGDIDIYEPLK